MQNYAQSPVVYLRLLINNKMDELIFNLTKN